MNWLPELFSKLFFWLPRFWFVHPDESGVKITLGKWVKDCGPGWYIDWPLVHVHIKVNVAIQGVRFAIQSITTKDDINLAIRGAILYRITNARRAIFETADFDQSLEAVACGVIESFTADKTYEEIKDRKALKVEIMKGLRDEANVWGIRLLKVYITDIGRVTNIRILGNNSNSVIPYQTEKG